MVNTFPNVEDCSSPSDSILISMFAYLSLFPHAKKDTIDTNNKIVNVKIFFQLLIDLNFPYDYILKNARGTLEVLTNIKKVVKQRGNRYECNEQLE